MWTIYGNNKLIQEHILIALVMDHISICLLWQLLSQTQTHTDLTS